MDASERRFRDEEISEIAPGFGTIGELQDCLIDAGLVIALGMGEDDEFAVTPRGETVYNFLGLSLREEGRLEE